jgi:hypothetical protein
MSLSRLPLPVDRAVLGKSFSYHARETGRLLQESLLQYHRTHASYEVPPDYITPTGDPLGACIALLRLLRQGSSAQVNALGIRSLLTALDAVPGFAWQVGTVAAGAVAASAARVSGLAAAHGGLLLDAVRQSTGEDRQTLARDYAALVAALESGAMSRDRGDSRVARAPGLRGGTRGADAGAGRDEDGVAGACGENGVCGGARGVLDRRRAPHRAADVCRAGWDAARRTNRGNTNWETHGAAGEGR